MNLIRRQGSVFVQVLQPESTQPQAQAPSTGYYGDWIRVAENHRC